jgi:hypothetical protein
MRASPRFFHAWPALIVLLHVGVAQAEFFGALPVTLGGSDWQAYYDDQLDITWVANANLAGTRMNWGTADAWASNLVINGVGGWRLPSMDVDESGAPYLDCEEEGVTQAQCMDDEYAHLYFYGAGTILGDGVTESDPAPFSNLGPFAGTALPSGAYWSGTPGSVGQHRFFRFADSSGGSEAIGSDTSNLYAWAVHDGDVRNLTAPTVPGLQPWLAVTLVALISALGALAMRGQAIR